MDDRDRVQQVALDYFEGWFDGDVQRMDRALHKDLVKRSPGTEGAVDLAVTSKARMLELTEQGEGAADRGDGRLAVDVVDVHGDIANVVVHGGVYREYLQMVRTRAGWKIANALWTYEK
jgi:ketosteroid isomerase-like protein